MRFLQKIPISAISKTTLSLFIVSVGLSFFGLFFSLFSPSKTSLQNEFAQRARFFFSGLAQSYLEETAQRLGDDFNAAFYESVVESGYDRLDTAIQTAAEIALSRTESAAFIKSLSADSETESESLDTDIVNALEFLAELEGNSSENDSLPLTFALSDSPQESPVNIAFSQAFLTIDFPSKAQSENPLNQLRFLTAAPLSPPVLITSALLLKERLLPVTNWASWLFSLLSFISAMFDANGTTAVFTGMGQTQMAFFFQSLWLLLFSQLSFLFLSLGSNQTALRCAGTRGDFPLNSRLLERRSVVLLR